MRHHIPLSIIATILLSSCGGGGSSSPITATVEENLSIVENNTTTNQEENLTEAKDTNVNTPTTPLTKGYLIDSPISGAYYSCGDIVGITNQDGEFSCRVTPVEFSVGGISLGKLENFTIDGKVYPQDLLNLKRDNFDDKNLTKLLQIIQSLDDDGDITDRINITQDTRDKLKNIDDINISVDIDTAINHLKKSMGIKIEEKPKDEQPKQEEEKEVVVTYIKLNTTFDDQNSSITYKQSLNYIPNKINITSSDKGEVETSYLLNNQSYISGEIATLNIGDNNFTATTIELDGDQESQTISKTIYVQDPNYINANFDINLSDGNITLEKDTNFTIPTPTNITGDGDYNISAMFDNNIVKFGDIIDLNETKDINLTYTLSEPPKEEGVSDGEVIIQNYILNILDTTPPSAPIVSNRDSTSSSSKNVEFRGEVGSVIIIDEENRGEIGDNGYGYVNLSLPSYTTYHFVAKLQDKNGNKSEPTSFSITRYNPNHSPVANPDTAQVKQGESVVIDVLNNDTDSDGDTLNITGTPTASVGSVVIENKKLKYTAPSSGSDIKATISYAISDGNGGSSSTLFEVPIDIPTDFSNVSVEDQGLGFAVSGTVSDENGIETVDISFDDGSDSSHYSSGELNNEAAHNEGTIATIVVKDKKGNTSTKEITLN